MNARKAAPEQAAVASGHDPIKSVAVTLSSDLGLAAAANHDQLAEDAHVGRVNPLWMITVGLAMFFVLIALLTTFD